MNYRRWVSSLVGWLLAFEMCTCALAQEPPATAAAAAGRGDPVEQGADSEEPGADAKASAKRDGSPGPIKEKTIYIPYSKLREVFEREGRGVFLPYAEFQQLWKAARDRNAPPVPDRPPVPALITEVENEAVVSRDVVRVEAVVKIEVLAKGWHRIPLGLGDAAVTSAKIGGESARVVFEANTGYQLLYENKSAEPVSFDLVLDYAKAYTKAPGQNSVAFDTPQAPVSRWRLRLPEAGVKVNIQPLIAATEVPPEKPDEGNAPAETVVLAYVGAAPQVRIDWTPKAEGATGLEALAGVQVQQQVRIDEGVVRTQIRLDYDISRAQLAQLVMRVPSDQKVVNVTDANVRQWSVEEVNQGEPGAAQDATMQEITAQLFEPAKGRQTVIVELEKFTLDAAQQELTLPVIQAMGVGRQQGLVVVLVTEGLRAEVARRTGLVQVDAAELPPELANVHWAFSYRYATVPWELGLQVEKVQPRITVDTLVEATLTPDVLTLDVLAIYTIERAGAFRLEWDVPPGYTVRYVRGRAAAGAQPAEVDSFHVEGENSPKLIVNLARKAFGRVALSAQLERRLTEPNLQSPTGQAATLDLPLPRPAAEAVARSTGRVLIHAPESLRINPGQLAGLRVVSFQEALAGTEPAREQPAPSVRPVLAFAFDDEAASLTLAAERRKPQVTVRQLLVAKVEPGVAEYTATFHYEIRYSGVKSLRIDVPAELAGRLRNDTTGVREKVIEPPPADLDADYIAWSLAGETEFLGEIAIELAWEDEIKELDVGKSLELKLPHLRPREVDRAWGQVVLIKSETIDVQEAGVPQGLRPIDPAHDLMPGASVEGAARAFEFHDDWTLTAKATRYQLEEIKVTSIELAVLRMVLTRSNQLSVQALYRLRSAEQRLAVNLPAKVEFDTEPLKINGRRVALERGAGDVFYVPLVGQNPDAPFMLEIRYAVPAEQKRLDFPVFPTNPAVQKVYLSAYVPSELVCVATTGPWTDEYAWESPRTLEWKPVPKFDDAALVKRVTEGIDVAGDPLSSFPADGRRFLFSTLRPADPPGGAIELKTIRESWLHSFALAAVVLIGLVLTPVRVKVRVAVAGAAAIALVLLAVFQPMFVLAVLNVALVGAVVVVLIVWAGWDVVRRVPRTAQKPAATHSTADSPFKPGESPPAETAVPAVEPPANPDGGSPGPAGGSQEGGPQS
ncbi:MAG TPA: hypothetical protein VGX76_23270 [Pirellulales bacterium]|nr:hypothetical protein [Pirellulales bacterium]